MPIPVNTDICHECINLIKTSNEALPTHIAKWLSNQRVKSKVAPELLKIANDNDIPMLFETGYTLHQIRIYVTLKTNPTQNVNISKDIKKSPIYKWIESLLPVLPELPKSNTKADMYIDHINDYMECMLNKTPISETLLTKINNIKRAFKRDADKLYEVTEYANEKSILNNVPNPITTKHLTERKNQDARQNIVNALKEYAKYVTEFNSLPTDKYLIRLRDYIINKYRHNPVHKYTQILNELGLTEYFKYVPKTQPPEFDLSKLNEYAEFIYTYDRKPFFSRPDEKNLAKWLRQFKYNVNKALTDNRDIKSVLDEINKYNLNDKIINPPIQKNRQSKPLRSLPKIITKKIIVKVAKPPRKHSKLIDTINIYTKRNLRDIKKLIGVDALNGLMIRTHRLYVWKETSSKTNHKKAFIAPVNDNNNVIWKSEDTKYTFDQMTCMKAFTYISGAVTNTLTRISTNNILVESYVLDNDAVNWFKNNPNCENEIYN